MIADSWLWWVDNGTSAVHASAGGRREIAVVAGRGPELGSTAHVQLHSHTSDRCERVRVEQLNSCQERHRGGASRPQFSGRDSGAIGAKFPPVLPPADHRDAIAFKYCRIPVEYLSNTGQTLGEGGGVKYWSS
jgi:hypothetical protein